MPSGGSTSLTKWLLLSTFDSADSLMKPVRTGVPHIRYRCGDFALASLDDFVVPNPDEDE
ncbi:hypothetical protein NHQ30_007581 [Ciborinia camelliae]|nr:hypothetical protein NHQ30_007581 [Ciborinia camelliae]